MAGAGFGYTAAGRAGPTLGEFAYRAGELRDGGARAAQAADVVARVRARWAGRSVDGLLFGEVAGAAELGTLLTSTAEGQTSTADAVDTAHRSLDERSHATAELGDQLVVDTTALAGDPAPGPH